MECLVDESYECKSLNIHDTLDCEECKCSYYIKVCEYYKKIEENKKMKNNIKNELDRIFFKDCRTS